MSTRTVPMQVLCLGMGRTGTQSLADALAILGISPVYHQREVRKNSHTEAWAALLERKKEGLPIAVEHFDAILGNFAATTDFPAIAFSRELIDAYPSAHLILTTRDTEAWLASMNSTLFTIPKSAFFEHFFGAKEEWGGEDSKSAFREHNEDVKRWARERGREVLVYEVREGWGPLCEFLEKDVPGEGFPRSDDWATMGWKKVVQPQEEEEKEG